MTADLLCPHCGATASPLPGDDGLGDCTSCQRSFGVPGMLSAAPAETPRRDADGPRAHAPTDVSMVWTGAAAIAGTAVFFLTVVQTFEGSYFADLFGERGWVPYVIAWLSIWAAALLGTKAWRLTIQRKAFELDLLPESIAHRVTPDNARAFIGHLRQVAAPVAPSFLAERLERALETYRLRRNTREVLEQLGVQSNADAAAVESSYTMVRVFIWAIPILGFIGTVIGIGAAVAGFSDSVAEAVDLEVMKHSIGAVTSGLGVAFDTTLLALVMSIFIMFPASSLQKAEEDFLGQVDVWCEEQLARRLDDGDRDEAGQADPIDLLRAEISRLAGSLDALERKLG